MRQQREPGVILKRKKRILDKHRVRVGNGEKPGDKEERRKSNSDATNGDPRITPGSQTRVAQKNEAGSLDREARMSSAVPMHRTTVYRLLKRVEREGEHALSERRHGHPIKLRGEVLTWVMDYCQSHPSAPSAEVQHLLTERFGLSVSVSQLNRVRATHGLSRSTGPARKKSRKPAW